ncbi:hypothetical protein Q7I37_19315, partial [Aeromonas allosaccharophila]|uniref:hypothetical protein n=1 Tax=Aeromonas allosaccharophila TaxID=656 RepID=UPI003006248D
MNKVNGATCHIKRRTSPGKTHCRAVQCAVLIAPYEIQPKTKGALSANASQLSLTGIVFIGFFHTIPLGPW